MSASNTRNTHDRVPNTPEYLSVDLNRIATFQELSGYHIIVYFIIIIWNTRVLSVLHCKMKAHEEREKRERNRKRQRTIIGIALNLIKYKCYFNA